MPTYKPSAMHSSSRVSPLRTILVLVAPRGSMKPGRRSPSGLSEHMRTHTTKSELERNIRLEGWSCHSLRSWVKPWAQRAMHILMREICSRNIHSDLWSGNDWVMTQHVLSHTVWAVPPNQRARGISLRGVTVGLLLWQHSGSNLGGKQHL